MYLRRYMFLMKSCAKNAYIKVKVKNFVFILRSQIFILFHNSCHAYSKGDLLGVSCASPSCVGARLIRERC
ncbi:unnamed protein product, partial [Amoebophrya sp. A25]|eukprot:GSA25T00027879001.1